MIPAPPLLDDLPAGFAEAYRRETHVLLRQRLRSALAVGTVLYALFWGLDWYVAPPLAMEFLLIRLLVVGFALATIAATYTAIGDRLLVPLSVTMLVVASFGISWMTVELGGFGSDYYFGNMLVLFFVGLFMPWRLIVTLVFCALLTGAYLVANLAFHGFSSSMVTATFYLAATSAFTCAATIAGDRRRRADLVLRLHLQRANEDLKKVDEAKTRFFNNVSHELRTPLMLILGPLDSILSGNETVELRPLHETMRANAQRLLRQVHMILDFARIEAGRLTLEPSEDNVGGLARELVWAAEPYAERRGLELRLEGLDDVQDSVFDRPKVETVVANLLSNALKFTPVGGRVTVRAKTTSDAVVLEVEDTGMGIPEGELERIFDRFHQVDGGLARRTDGTGLGLALAREIVWLHGGQLEVDSTVGQGSTFRVTLPFQPVPPVERRQKVGRRREDRLARAHFEAALRQRYESGTARDVLLADLGGDFLQEDATPAGPIVSGPDDGPRVLVVEDNPDLLRFLQRELSAVYRVEGVRDGEQALEAVHSNRPDVIVSDVMMPHMDGYELCRRLRADPTLVSLPILLLTAKAGSDAVVEGLAVGANDYIAKPFDVRELQARIAVQLRIRAAESALHERESRLAAIGQMTSSVVHDLRNPLHAIMAYAEMLLDPAMQHGDMALVKEDVEEVKRAAERAFRMTEEVVEFARMGDVQMCFEPTHLGSFVERVCAEHGGLLGRGVDITVRRDDDGELEAPIDRERFRRVVENLLANARDALSNVTGAVVRRIQVEVRAEPVMVRVVVSDNGPGIPVELLPRLFQPFATAGKAGGTGLGLAVVRNVVAAHGGTVTAANSEHGGAVFTLRIPRRRTRASGVHSRTSIQREKQGAQS